MGINSFAIVFHRNESINDILTWHHPLFKGARLFVPRVTSGMEYIPLRRVAPRR